jgi:hypothetical protein
MTSRRTKNERAKAHHQFIVSWSNEAKKIPFEPDVKGQFHADHKAVASKEYNSENALTMAKEESLTHIKRDIVKSLILSSFILGTEVVIYLLWH